MSARKYSTQTGTLLTMLADVSREEEVEFGKNWTAGAWPRREIEKETVIVVELLEQIPLGAKLRGPNTREREGKGSAAERRSYYYFECTRYT